MVGHTHTVKVSRADWIIVAQTHDGIVTREEFDRAQEAMRKFEERNDRPHENNPLRRKVICGICGHAMVRTKEPNAYYSCHTSRVTFNYLCTEEPVSAAEVQGVVLSGLRVQSETAVEMERLWAELHQGKADYLGNVQKNCRY